MKNPTYAQVMAKAGKASKNPTFAQAMAEAGKTSKGNKFSAKRTTVDGITFDSAKEARRYGELKLLERAAEVSHLETQPVFECRINGALICRYKADFRYFDIKRQARIVEDVKGHKDGAAWQVYRLKKKMVEALYPGVTIEEI